MANGDGAITTKVVVGVLGGLILAGITGLTVNAVKDAAWKARAEKIHEEDKSAATDAKIALQVVEQHGSEFVEVRSTIGRMDDRLLAVATSIDNLRTSMNDRFAEVLGRIDEKANDRFRASEWARERELLDLQFEKVASEIEKLRVEIKALKRGS